MWLLVDSEFKSIYNIGNYNTFIDHEKIFQEKRNYKDKKALITMASRFNPNASSGHTYSILAAWN